MAAPDSELRRLARSYYLNYGHFAVLMALDEKDRRHGYRSRSLSEYELMLYGMIADLINQEIDNRRAT